MKKLINDPQTVVAESLEGFGAAHADVVSVHSDPWFVTRAGGAVCREGRPRQRRRQRARAAARRASSASACSTRPSPGAVFTSPTPDPILAATKAVDGGAGVLRDRQELHRRRAELRDRGGARRRRGYHGAHRHRQRRRRGQGLAVDGRPPRCRGHRRWSRRSPVRRPSGATTSTRSTAIAEKVIANARSMGVALTACIVPHAGEAELRPAPRTRSRSASASTASRAGAASRWRAPTRSPSCCSSTRRRRPGALVRRECPAVRQRHGRHPAASSSTSSIVGLARCSRSAGSS